MITLPPGVRVWLATGHTDMRKGFPGLALCGRNDSSPGLLARLRSGSARSRYRAWA